MVQTSVAASQRSRSELCDVSPSFRGASHYLQESALTLRVVMHMLMHSETCGEASEAFL